MLAPNHVSAPATTHTSSMPAKLGTARLTSDGCTKIDAPTIVPTTIAVACVSPIDRASLGIGPSRVARDSAGRHRLRRAARMLSPYRRRFTGRLLVDFLNRFERVRFRGRLVGAVPLDAGEAQRQTAGILRARLDV